MVGICTLLLRCPYWYPSVTRSDISLEEKEVLMSIYCKDCNYAYNPDNVTKCIVCGNALVPVVSTVVSSQSITVPNVAVNRPTSHGQSSGSTVITGNTQGLPGVQGAPNVLIGRITHLERNDERTPVNIYRSLSRLMIGILIAIPYAIFFVALGVISLFFGILGIHSLSQLFNPIIWTSSIFRVMEVFLLRNIRGSDTLPVYRGTIEDASGIEQHFMIRGPLIGGNLIVGSRVRMTGKWQNGTLYALYGEDTSSQTAIRTSYSDPWKIIFFVLLTLYVALGLCAFFTSYSGSACCIGMGHG